MKTRTWLIAIGALLMACIGLTAVLFQPGEPAARAEIRSGGKLVKTVDLAVEQTFTVTTAAGGENVISVRNGKIAVTAASCPDHYCMARGYCDSGAQIVCLPNQLTITFLGETQVDIALG